jgi:SNF2 family DNA or RNA helicase
MGLGKTCQILTFLMEIHLNNHKINPNHDPVHAIIYPPFSLLYYWAKEFEKWRNMHIMEL